MFKEGYFFLKKVKTEKICQRVNKKNVKIKKEK